MKMESAGRAASVKQSSGLLLNAPASLGGEVKALKVALSKLSAVTKALSANVRHINENMERILLDKPDIEEMERMLYSLSQNKE
ncbi:hypothetical protein GDO86_008612 [Hymenochirus boettgeri]|uniref:Uncharacterized protein n=1 Tax=Hymenochirus boettgeri TaxID=247094 RepID=A0A8T2J3N5_9PIPI|nr:hypothetical protein GDO86_008612 [Hymenochirus boettgeri]